MSTIIGYLEVRPLLESKRYFRIRPFSQSFKAAFTLTGVAVLCVTCFYLGSVNNSNQFEMHEIEAIRNLLLEDNIQNQRAKRDVNENELSGPLPLVSRLKKRSTVERPILRVFDGGVTYTRWGRRDCPKGIDTNNVYSGTVAGSYYTHNGGGANRLCLISNFTYEPGKFVDGFQDGSYIYGAEYRTANTLNSLLDFKDFGGTQLSPHNVPCAVCIATARFSQMMIPGIGKCPSGWVQEYSGYIMGPHHHHKRGEYVCVDESPQAVPGSAGDNGGALFYMVEAVCPSLLCGPYVNGRELRCVVCTK